MILEVGLAGADAVHLGHAGAVDATGLGEEAVGLVALPPGVVGPATRHGVRDPVDRDGLRASRSRYRSPRRVPAAVVGLFRLSVGLGLQLGVKSVGLNGSSLLLPAPAGMPAHCPARRIAPNSTVIVENRRRRGLFWKIPEGLLNVVPSLDSSTRTSRSSFPVTDAYALLSRPPLTNRPHLVEPLAHRPPFPMSFEWLDLVADTGCAPAFRAQGHRPGRRPAIGEQGADMPRLRLLAPSNGRPSPDPSSPGILGTSLYGRVSARLSRGRAIWFRPTCTVLAKARPPAQRLREWRDGVAVRKYRVNALVRGPWSGHAQGVGGMTPGCDMRHTGRVASMTCRLRLAQREPGVSPRAVGTSARGPVPASRS